VKSYVNKLRVRWKWRKTPKSEFPLRYTGKPIKVRKTKLEHGTPLTRRLPGPKGAHGGGRYMTPDGIERILSPFDTETR
jgi:hypothetical protein